MFSALRTRGIKAAQELKRTQLLKRTSSAVSETAAAPGEYTKPMRKMHWVMGGAIVGCVLSVKLAQEYNKKDGRLYNKENPRHADRQASIMWAHKSIGLLIAGLALPRFGLRLISKLPSPVPGHPLEIKAGNIMHGALYFFMAFMPASGIAMGLYGGGLPFFFTKIEPLEGVDKEVKKFVSGNAYTYHKQVGQIFEYLIPIHAGAVAFHFMRGTNILNRMKWGGAAIVGTQVNTEESATEGEEKDKQEEEEEEEAK